MMMSLNCYQIRLLRTAIEYFVDAKQDEIDHDWTPGYDDEGIENCKAWINDAWEVDELLKIMYRTAVGKVLE